MCLNGGHSNFNSKCQSEWQSLIYIFTSKIDLIDSIFQLYKEMEIESLIQELGLIEDIDYSKIDRYLDKGIYLDNHAIF